LGDWRSRTGNDGTDEKDKRPVKHVSLLCRHGMKQKRPEIVTPPKSIPHSVGKIICQAVVVIDVFQCHCAGCHLRFRARGHDIHHHSRLTEWAFQSI
jgi:hypothetical protein